jgi:hypothetical protein
VPAAAALSADRDRRAGDAGLGDQAEAFGLVVEHQQGAAAAAAPVGVVEQHQQVVAAVAIQVDEGVAVLGHLAEAPVGSRRTGRSGVRRGIAMLR